MCRIWVDRLCLPRDVSPERCGNISPNTAQLLSQLRTQVLSPTPGTPPSSLPTFAAPPSLQQTDSLSDVDTDLEVDVESVSSSRLPPGSSPLRLLNQSRSSISNRFNQSGSSTSVGIRARRRSNQSQSCPILTGLLLTAEVTEGVYEGTAADVEVRFGSTEDADNEADACDPNRPSTSPRTSYTTLSASSSCNIDSVNSNFDDESSPCCLSSPPRKRARPSGGPQHSSQFSLLPASRFLTLDSPSQLTSNPSFQLISSNSSSSLSSSIAQNSISSFPAFASNNLSNCDTDVSPYPSSSTITAQPTQSPSQSSCSSPSISGALHTPSSSSNHRCTSSNQSSTCTLSNQSSSHFVATNSSSSNSNLNSSLFSRDNSFNAIAATTCTSSNLVFFPSNSSSSGSYSSASTASDSLLIATSTTATSDTVNRSSDSSGTCLNVNNVDSANKLTSNNNRSSPVSTSALVHPSVSSVTNTQGRQSSNSTTIFSVTNNASGHEVVYFNAARSVTTNNGNNLLLNTAPSLRNNNKVFTARAAAGNVSVGGSNTSGCVNSNNTGKLLCGVAGSGHSTVSNGPSNRNNLLLSNKVVAPPSKVITSSSASTNNTTPAVVQCTKLDQYLFRDS